MQHFVKVMHGYLALQVTQVSWHQFQTELKSSVRDLDGLYDSHNRFINRCLLRLEFYSKISLDSRSYTDLLTYTNILT